MSVYDGLGSLEVQDRINKGMTPEQLDALVKGEYLPDRMAEFRTTRDGEQARRQGQLDHVRQAIANNPIQVRGNNVGLQFGGLLANALRDFGGMYVANQKEKQMADAKTASDAQFQNLVKMGEASTRAGRDTSASGISEALRRFEEERARNSTPWAQPSPGYGVLK